MTTAITHSTQSLTTSSTASTAQPSFLQRCIEDLSPDKVSFWDTESTKYTIIAAVTFVAFSALAVSTFVTAGILFPVYLPFVGLGALFAAMPVASWVKNNLDYSVSSKNEANAYNAIQKNYADLSQKEPLAIQVDLISRGITWFQIPGISLAQPDAVKTLNPILAKAKHLDDVIQQRLKERDDLSEEANQLAATDFTQNRKQIYDLRNSALFAEDRALETKIQAAFVNAVLRKGDFNGNLEDLAAISNIAYNERILTNELNQGVSLSEHNVLTFNNTNLVPITHAEIKRLTVAELGRRIVAAM